MRKIGTLNLRIGLAQIPLAINSFLDYQGISFKQLCPKCETPIKYKRVCSNCNKEVEYAELKSGLQLSKSNIVVIDKEIFKNLKLETKILAIIKTNSEFEFITERCYLLTPDEKVKKPYFLLRNLLLEKNKSLVVEFSFRNKVHLAIIKPINFSGVVFLMLKQILYSDKIKDITPLKEEELTEEELKLGRELFELISKNIENKSYMDIRDKRLELLEKVLSGKVKPQTIKKIKETELKEQLKKSVELVKIKTKKVQKKKLENS